MKKNLFITFEGIEGSGKSNQTRLLAQYLTEQGFEVVVTREPGGTEISDMIREILLQPANTRMTASTEALLYAASRAQHVLEVIKPALEQGKTVLSDRYIDSSVAYQVFGRGLPLEMVSEINIWASQGLKPDLTFLLEVPVEEGLKRATKRTADRIEQEEIDFHHRVAEGYRWLAQKEKERIYSIDGLKTKEEIHCEIRKIVDGFIKRD
jgi:dTMP kinase